MDFTTHRHEAKQNTALLVVLLAMGILAIVAAVSVVFTVLFSFASDGPEPLAVITVAAPITAVAVIGTALIKSARIRGGGGAYVATSMGGRKIDADTRDPRRAAPRQRRRGDDDRVRRADP